MEKRKLITKSKLLIAGAVAGCFAGGVQAATPPVPPTVPTAPSLPSFQEMVVPAYQVGSDSGYSDGTPIVNIPFVPAQYSIGGYSTIKDPSSLASEDSTSSSSTASGGSSIRIHALVGQNSCTAAVLQKSTLTTVDLNDPSLPPEQWSATDSGQIVTVPVLAGATLGALVEQTVNDPIEVTQTLTVADGSSNFATGSYSSYYNAFGGGTSIPFQQGLFAVGSGGYPWLKGA